VIGTNGGVRRPAGSVVLAAIVCLAAMLTAAVMFTTGDAGMQRLALLVGILSPTILTLVGTLRADTAAARLDGSLDDRIAANVHRAMAARRNGEPIPEKPPRVAATPIELEK
jgi:hypothetical protein